MWPLGGWEANPRWGSQVGGGGIINRRKGFYIGRNGERGPHPKNNFLNSDAVTRGFKKPHGMDLDLVYRAENRCQSSWASAGAFPRPPRGRVEPGIGPKSMIFGHTTPPTPEQKLHPRRRQPRRRQPRRRQHRAPSKDAASKEAASKEAASEGGSLEVGSLEGCSLEGGSLEVGSLEGCSLEGGSLE